MRAKIESRPEQRMPLPALTGIRVFAAYYVVMLHTGSGYFSRHGFPPLIVSFLQKGYLAVSLFFVLSGFILAYTYEGKIAGRHDVAHFWTARFARIYPVYFLSLAFMVPFSRGMALSQRFVVLSMVQAWIPWKPELIGAWNFPAWSLSVEAFFYAVFPWIVLGVSRLKLVSLRLLGCLLLAIIAVGNLARPIEEWAQSSANFVRFIPLPLVRLPEFIVGIILGLLFLRSPGMRQSGIISLCAVVGAIAILCLFPDRWSSFVIIPFSILLASLARQSGPVAGLLSTKTFVLLGGASYAVYLLQLPIRISMRLLVATLPHAPHDLDAFLSPFVLLVSSIFIFLLWEEPVRKFLRRTLGLRPRWKWPYISATRA